MDTRKICECLAELWKAMAAEEIPGVYLFEIRKFSELETTPSVFKAIVEFMDGYFADHLNPTGILDFREKCDFGFAEAFSRKLGLGGKVGLRGFRYKLESYGPETQVVGYIRDYESSEENGKVKSEERVVDVNQSATSLMVSVLASPVIGQALRKKIVGLLFEDHLIDRPNVEKLCRYFVDLKDQPNYGDMRIYLLVVSERLGANEIYFDDHIQRMGIVKDYVFMKTNPYSACVRRVETISGGISKETPFVLFLGAGASAEAKTESGENLPLGDDLKKIAIRSVLNKPELENETLEVLVDKFRGWLEASRSLMTNKGETRDNVKVTLERVLREEFINVPASSSRTLNLLRTMSSDAIPPSGYTDMKEIIGVGYHPILITTNYDPILERVLGDYTEYCVKADFVSKEPDLLSYLKGENEKVPILKIHGSLSDPESIEESVNSPFRLPDEIYELLNSIYTGEINKQFGEIPIQTFFIGYSFRDQDVWEFFSYPHVKKKMKPYIVNPSPSLEIQAFFMKNQIKEYMQAMVSMPFSKFARVFFNQLQKAR